MKRLYMVALGLAAVSIHGAPTISWQCDEASWKAPPKVQDGTYKSTLEIDCKLSGIQTRSFDPLINAIRKTIDERSHLHRPASRIRLDGLSGWSFDATHLIEDTDSKIQLREEIQIASNQKRLVYQTRSKSVGAEGFASHLKHVAFRTELRVHEDYYSVQMENHVAVARPWYAISPIFKLVAKQVAKDKFSVARGKLQEFIENSLAPAPIASP